MKLLLDETERKVDETTVFDSLLALFYKMAAQDHIYGYLAQFKGTEMFSRHAARIKSISNNADLERFVRELPDQRELQGLVKAEIRKEYAGIEPALKRIEEERQAAVAHPSIDYSGFWEELSGMVGKTFEVKGLGKEVRTESQFIKSWQGVVSQIAESLDRKANVELVSGYRPGDIVSVVDFLGFNPEDNAKTYYHDGSEDDVPKGSKGTLTNIVADDRFEVTFVVDGSEKKWYVHSGEIKASGKNIYKDKIDKAGGNPTKAAELAVAEVRAALEEKYLGMARENAGRMFEVRATEVRSALENKFGLNAQQLGALAKGKDFGYEVAADFRGLDFRFLFKHLSLLTRFAFNYKGSGNVKEVPTDATSEKDFRKYAIGLAKELAERKGDSVGLLKKHLDLIGTLLWREYHSTERLEGVEPAKRLEHTLRKLTERNNRVSTVRRMMYNDQDLFIAEPFSPPSETHDHVIILQPEYGCTHRCTYCTGNIKKLTVRSVDEFREHAKEVKRRLGRDIEGIRRLFLSGSNFFRHDTPEVLEYLAIANEVFRGHIGRIAAFTRTEGLTSKSTRELNRIYNNNLQVLYWGVETGSDLVLEYVRKKTTFEQMSEAARKARDSYMKLSVMIMPGLGGLKYYEDHVVGTAKILDAIRPRYITFLTVLPEDHSEYAQIMADEQARGQNMPLDDAMAAEQIYDIVRMMKGDFNCLAAAYKAPFDKVGRNPVEFRARFEDREKRYILSTIEGYFSNGIRPSPFIPETSFNRNSPLRRMAADNN